MRPIYPALLIAAALGTPALAKDLKVAASIKPVHSIISAVMQGAGTPDLLVEGNITEHTASLTPDKARIVQEADVIFWIGHGMENFLAKPLEGTVPGVGAELSEIPGIEILKPREGGAFEAHDHEEHGAHEGEEAGGNAHDEEADLHVWLDPANAGLMAMHAAQVLAAKNPGQAALYEANAQAFAARMTGLTAELQAELAPFKDKHFIVFHDAYHYFENRFGLEASGAITINPDVMPGAQRLAELRALIQKTDTQCVLAEPQFDARLADVITEGTNARRGVLDPLGADIPAGPGQYEALLKALAGSLKSCLGGQ